MDNGASSYRRFLDGDDEGIVEIIKEYKDGLMLFINRYVDNIHIAEELTEDVFVRLVTKKPHFVAKYSFKTWLYTIGKNTAFNYLKRQKRHLDIADETMEQVMSDEKLVEEAYIREEQKRLLLQTLSRLNSDYSQALYLKYFEDMDNEQIGKILGKQKRQIENLLYQAKQKLRQELEKEGFVYEGL